METIFERVAGLDVHKARVTACVRVPTPSGGREQHLAEFPTVVRGLMGLRDWLEAHGVTHVAIVVLPRFGRHLIAWGERP